MLSITIPATAGEQLWDERKEEFVYRNADKERKLQLEHSLVSISKWEAKWNKAFLSEKTRKSMTNEQALDYIKCMTITQNVNPFVYERLTKENMDEIERYMNAPMTAVYLPKKPQNGGAKDVVTSELIYYWMISYQIPVEFEKWHLNRLMALIRVFDMKNSKGSNRSQKQLISDYAQLNAERRKAWGTKG